MKYSLKYPWKQKILESKKIELLLVALLLLAAIVIRAYHFGAPPIGVHQDEAMAAVDAKALADYGTDRYGMRYPVHFTAWRTSQMSVLLSYCMIPFIKLLGFSTVSTRLPMLVISCLGLLALYLFGRQLAGKWTGMIVLILGTISPWHYMQSRWSFDCNLFPHVFLIAVVLLIAGLKKKPLLLSLITHLRAHETKANLVCRLLLEKKKQQRRYYTACGVGRRGHAASEGGVLFVNLDGEHFS